MGVEIEPELESRLEQIAGQRSIPVARLVEQILETYLNSLPDSPDEWVRTTQQQLVGSWPHEDFSDWQPPHRSAWKG
jgi:hypothetical protein